KMDRKNGCLTKKELKLEVQNMMEGEDDTMDGSYDDMEDDWEEEDNLEVEDCSDGISEPEYNYVL
ncbi:hypothetical protein HHI36_016801, partial [Cryptolaemus montrouzieri]